MRIIEDGTVNHQRHNDRRKPHIGAARVDYVHYTAVKESTTIQHELTNTNSLSSVLGVIIIIIIIIVANIKVTVSHKNVAGELYTSRRK